jgi:hypothetical protein
METPSRQPERKERDRPIPTVSTRLPDGRLVELVYNPKAGATAFVVGMGDDWATLPFVDLQDRRLVPYHPQNNLIRHEVVLFARRPEEYGTAESLVASIRAYIHRYVDVSPLFETLASYYVLLTWVYDAFNELPYLRLRGDPGSGKTRFLLTVGALCYKPIFASGASTVSPLFRLLDTFRGTLIVDEGDFRHSDERAEIVKILNNGNARGFPVLRSELLRKGEFDPRAYQVFGPKLVATRGFFEDRALESRCLTEEMGSRRLRDDIPINLPPAGREEADQLRNQLLLFRLRALDRARPLETLVDRAVEPRLNQVFVPLLSVIEDLAVQADLRALMHRYHRDLVQDRTMDTEAEVVAIVDELLRSVETGQVAVREITARFIERHGEDYERKVTPRWIGSILRRKLGLHPERRHGTFVIPPSEFPKVERLREKYGIEPEQDNPATEVDVGDIGDIVPVP